MLLKDTLNIEAILTTLRLLVKYQTYIVMREHNTFRVSCGSRLQKDKREYENSEINLCSYKIPFNKITFDAN